MTDLSGVRVGFALTGSFCTLSKTLEALKAVVECGADVTPIMSEITASTDTRFGTAEYFQSEVKKITGKEVIISSIREAEPIGPKKLLDILVIAPCTGNTLTKLALGITDSCVTMAAKAHLRNGRPVVIGVSSNDGLSNTSKNLGLLMNSKNMYIVPYRQDDYEKKPTSLVSRMELIPDTIVSAQQGVQIQPLLIV
ncbi:MAG: dipicolinate synthase subunit B [Bacillota bacterium]|nr:dipicolinate synthase subunit B [Bacillota bacterium]